MLALLSGTSQAQQSSTVETANQLGVKSEDGRFFIQPKTGLWIVTRTQFNKSATPKVSDQKTYLCIGTINAGPDIPLPKPLPSLKTGYGFFKIPDVNVATQSSSKFYKNEKGIFANVSGLLFMGSYLLKYPVLDTVARGTFFATISADGKKMKGADSEYSPNGFSKGTPSVYLKDAIGTTTADWVSATDPKCK